MLLSGFHGDMSCWKSNPNGSTWLKLASLPPKNKNMSSIAHPILGKIGKRCPLEFVCFLPVIFQEDVKLSFSNMQM